MRHHYDSHHLYGVLGGRQAQIKYLPISESILDPKIKFSRRKVYKFDEVFTPKA